MLLARLLDGLDPTLQTYLAHDYACFSHLVDDALSKETHLCAAREDQRKKWVITAPQQGQSQRPRGSSSTSPRPAMRFVIWPTKFVSNYWAP